MSNRLILSSKGRDSELMKDKYELPKALMKINIIDYFKFWDHQSAVKMKHKKRFKKWKLLSFEKKKIWLKIYKNTYKKTLKLAILVKKQLIRIEIELTWIEFILFGEN